MIWSFLVKLTYSCIPDYNSAYYGNWERVSALRSDTLYAIRMVLHSHWAHVARTTEGNSMKCRDYPQHCRPIQFCHVAAKYCLQITWSQNRTWRKYIVLWNLWQFTALCTYCRNVHTKRRNKDTYGTTWCVLYLFLVYLPLQPVSRHMSKV